MSDEQIAALLGRIERFIGESEADAARRQDEIQGYALGQSLAVSALVSLLIEKKLLTTQEVEARLLAARSLTEGRSGEETAARALSHVADLVRPTRERAN